MKYDWQEKQDQRREERRKAKPKKVKLISLPMLLVKAQATFNLFIRTRDAGKPCISCGSFNTAHASHFYSAGKYSALRFNEMNCHLSCLKCNYHDHGNLLEYRKRLEVKIGAENLRKLDIAASLNRFKKWNRAELELIISLYKI